MMKPGYLLSILLALALVAAYAYPKPGIPAAQSAEADAKAFGMVSFNQYAPTKGHEKDATSKNRYIREKVQAHMATLSEDFECNVVGQTAVPGDTVIPSTRIIVTFTYPARLQPIKEKNGISVKTSTGRELHTYFSPPPTDGSVAYDVKGDIETLPSGFDF